MNLIGQSAPEFALDGIAPDGSVKNYKLSDFKKKWLVLFFYPLDFSPVCPTEVIGFSKMYDEFKKAGAEILGASGGSVFSHKDWLTHIGNVNYPLLCDMTHEVTRAYGALIEPMGVAARSTFIIDPEGKVHFAMYHDPNVGRSVKEVLRMLQALKSGDMCPVEWAPGEKTLGKLG